MGNLLRRLPLFPLNTVLFPGGTLPLHIFEPRYRAMTQACLAGDERFGVVLIAEGDEVGAPAIPHPTGTIARIALAETVGDGQFNLMTSGERRFTIVTSWLDPAGYLLADVHLRPDVHDTEPIRLASLTASFRKTLEEYIQALTDEWAPIVDELAEVTDPIHLCGVAASLVRGDNDVKQRILEDDSVPGRLLALQAIVKRELGFLSMIARPTRATLMRDILSPN